LAVVEPTPATVAVALTDPPAFAEVEPTPATVAVTRWTTVALVAPVPVTEAVALTVDDAVALVEPAPVTVAVAICVTMAEVEPTPATVAVPSLDPALDPVALVEPVPVTEAVTCWTTTAEVEPAPVAELVAACVASAVVLPAPVTVAVARIRLWAVRLLWVSRAAVEAAVRDLMERGRDEEAAPDKDGAGTGLGGIVGLLCREYGQSPEYWLFEVPSALARQLIEADLLVRNAAESQAARRSGGKVTAPDPHSYTARAFYRFQQAAQEWVGRKTAGGKRVAVSGGEQTRAASPAESSGRDLRGDSPCAPT
jgi:hypothetical protein